MIDSTTNFICNTTSGECFIISQTYLNYINTSLNDIGYLLDKIAGINMMFSAIIVFFLFMIVLKLYFANKK